jgi:hypothetical protein
MSKKNKHKEENVFNDEENYYSPSENEGPEVEDSDRVELPHTLTFKNPVKIGTKERTEIVFKYEPKAKSIRHLPVDSSKQKLGHFFPVVASMTDWTLAQVEELPIAVATKCVNIAVPFVADSETI